jgi:hypothetical protein
MDSNRTSQYAAKVLLANNRITTIKLLIILRTYSPVVIRALAVFSGPVFNFLYD